MSDNPYQPPEADPQQSPVLPAPAVPSGKQKQPFSLQAAKFSLYAPFVLILINLFVIGITAQQGADADRRELEEQAQIRFVISALISITMVAALVLGIVGFIGGIRRRAVGTIIMALLGVLINGGLVFLLIVAIQAAREAAERL